MENRIKHLLEKGCSAVETSEHLKISVRRVHYLANKQGLNFLRKSKYLLDYEIFSNKLHTETSYYILGYLFADGYVNPNKGSINITSADKEILGKISTLIGNIPIFVNTYDSFYIQWYSKRHVEELVKLGCVNNKSLTLKYPNWLKKIWNTIL